MICFPFTSKVFSFSSLPIATYVLVTLLLGVNRFQISNSNILTLFYWRYMFQQKIGLFKQCELRLSAGTFVFKRGNKNNVFSGKIEIHSWCLVYLNNAGKHISLIKIIFYISRI